MGHQTRRRALVAAVSTIAALAAAPGFAQAAFPRFSDCPLRGNDLGTCINIVSPTGYIVIKGFRVPLHDAIEIRGGLRFNEDGSTTFRPAIGTNGFFANPVEIPGGVLGIDLPISLNRVQATAQLAGVPSDIRISPFDLTVSMPMKLKLTNPLFGSGCTIGTNANPARVNLIIGTTSPPAPNRPISGTVGTYSEPIGPDGLAYVSFRGNSNVDNSVALPGASGCALGLGLINSIINAKMKLPSASGNNTIVVDNNVAFRTPQ